MPNEIYKDLKDASPEELLDVVKNQYLYSPFSYDDEGRWRGNPEHLMDIAFKIGKGEGWGCIALDWLKEYRERAEEKKAEEKKQEVVQRIMEELNA